uniref:Uncharacterized protein n=1 Tax=Rhizophora mucronata TaxID=61149 RepID=A0A2P2LFN7_RHIMU
MLVGTLLYERLGFW